MAIIRQPGGNPNLEFAPPPRPMTMPSPLRGPAPQAYQASGSEHIDLVSTDSIDDHAGVRHGLHKRPRPSGTLVTLQQLARQRNQWLRRLRGLQSGPDLKEDEETVFIEGVDEVLEMLERNPGRDSRDKLEARLERYLLPIQQLRVLVGAMKRAEGDTVPAARKAAIQRAVDAMISNLMKKHPHEIRAVLQETEEGGVKLDPMAPDLQSSVRLRLLIGARDKGKFDTPLTPLTVLKALIKNFGGDCLLAMCSLRSRMMAGL